jgi:UPF0716 family protein affecting phage T7 exclusion
MYLDSKREGNINRSSHLWGAVYGVAFTVLVVPGALSMFLGKQINS